MRRPGESGFAMIIVLWVAALLLAIVPVFVYSMRTESAAALNTADSTVARGLAAAGVEMAVHEIKGAFAIVASGDGGVVFMERSGSGFKPLPSDRRFELGGGSVSYTVEDERGRININTAERPVIDALLRLSGVEGAQRDVITDSILDWRDGNHEFHLNGAEDDYYASLPSPYGAKDGPADFKEELLLVKGVTSAVFNGSGSYSGIKNYITVHGDGRLNINTASQRALEAFYGKNIAGEILLKRQSEGYIPIPQNNGLVSSDIFTIESIGEYRSMRYRVEAVVLKKGTSGVHYVSWRDWGVSP
ncbi:hypothetical protein BAC1_00568 [uncultured bacterium]|nr:hypothetical protein BAC1_00568 [uncultured bacterium]